MMGNVGKIELEKDHFDRSDDGDDATDESPFVTSEQVRAAQKYKSRDGDEKHGYQEEWWMKFCRGDVAVVSKTSLSLQKKIFIQL